MVCDTNVGQKDMRPWKALLVIKLISTHQLHLQCFSFSIKPVPLLSLERTLELLLPFLYHTPRMAPARKIMLVRCIF